MNYLIVGVGPIAQEFAKVLKALGVSFTMVCRSPEKAQQAREILKCDVFAGGIEEFIKNSKASFDGAINAVDTESLSFVNEILIQSGKVKAILSEKPGAFTESEFQYLAKTSIQYNVELYIAYNRRNFSSVRKLKEILKQEPNTSIFFEFTEWFWRINPDEYSKNTLKEWVLCNSSHVLDIALYLGDGVQEISSRSTKSNDQSITNTQYVGHGIMNNGALFSYIADWESAGRWKVEASTPSGRYMLCPLERLFFQKRGTLEYIEVLLDTTLDEKYKPGFFLQVQSFISNPKTGLKSIHEQLKDIAIFNIIKGDY